MEIGSKVFYVVNYEEYYSLHEGLVISIGKDIIFLTNGDFVRSVEANKVYDNKLSALLTVSHDLKGFVDHTQNSDGFDHRLFNWNQLSPREQFYLTMLRVVEVPLQSMGSGV